nr:HD domain-containing protein [Xanthobacter tagetidis]
MRRRLTGACSNERQDPSVTEPQASAVDLFPDAPDLARRVAFILEIDKLKQVLRRTLLLDASRVENDAEHSWHMATMALVLHPYAEPGTDLLTVLKMLLVHDIVEIDAGDTYVYDAAASQTQAEREERAAERLFGLLPEPHAHDLREVWRAFERRDTREARFARAIDRLQPLLHSYHTEGRVWRQNAVAAADVRRAMAIIGDSSPRLATLAEDMISDAERRGLLR